MSYSENNTYELILDRALTNDALIDVDKRVGSIIYDALAPLCLELAEAYVKMDILEEQSYLLSATGTALEKKSYDYGVVRKEATQALRIGSFKKYKTDSEGEYELDSNGNKILVNMDITVGSRFTLPDDNALIYSYIGKTDGYNILQCEQTGTKGNSHIGTILPLAPIDGLIEAKITSTYTPAEDSETDEELRRRVQDLLTDNAFGGNIPDYIEKVNAISGVGNTKVFPAWNNGGSVLLSVVDDSYNPISDEFIATLKDEIDPEEATGTGVGIAPIGHYVTITTPVDKLVTVKASIELETDIEIGEVQEEIEGYVEDYFQTVRHNFGQNSTLAIYRARVTEAMLKCDKVLNVTSVLLNGADADIVYTDLAEIGYQYTPKLEGVELIG